MIAEPSGASAPFLVRIDVKAPRPTTLAPRRWAARTASPIPAETSSRGRERMDSGVCVIPTSQPCVTAPPAPRIEGMKQSGVWPGRRAAQS